MIMYNTLEQLPYLAYRIINYLFSNETIWKILGYDTYDCLEKGNLTEDEKVDLIWTKGEQSKKNVFLTPMEIAIIDNSKTVIKLYDYQIVPENHLSAIVCMRFEILYIGESAMIDYNGYPCSRLAVIKTELMKSLNGCDIGGVGKLEFNNMLSRWCGSTQSLGNNKNVVGDTLTFALRVSTLREREDNEN